MLKGGMMVSLKFSYWSSPNIKTASGLKESMAARTCLKPWRWRSWWSYARSTSCSHSSCIPVGQFFGSFASSGTFGDLRMPFRMPAYVSGLPPIKGG